MHFAAGTGSGTEERKSQDYARPIGVAGAVGGREQGRQAETLIEKGRLERRRFLSVNCIGYFYKRKK